MKGIALLFVLFYYHAFSQNVGVGILTPDASAKLDISSNNSGLLIPRMTSANIGNIINPAKGLMVYDSVTNQLMVNMGTPSLPLWQTVVSNSGWNLGGNANINITSQFLGTTDLNPLRLRLNNAWAGELNPSLRNIFVGLGAGESGSSGFANIGIGTGALHS